MSGIKQIVDGEFGVISGSNRVHFLDARDPKKRGLCGILMSATQIFSGEERSVCEECIKAWDASDSVPSSVQFVDGASEEKPDMVEHPPHYQREGMEVIDILEAWFPTDPLLWQVGKYLLRCQDKGNMEEDLRKARWYLSRRIGQLLDSKARRERVNENAALKRVTNELVEETWGDGENHLLKPQS